MCPVCVASAVGMSERGCRGLPLQKNRASFGVAVFGYLDNLNYLDYESFELFKMDTRQFVPHFWYDGLVLIIRCGFNN